MVFEFLKPPEVPPAARAFARDLRERLDRGEIGLEAADEEARRFLGVAMAVQTTDKMPVEIRLRPKPIKKGGKR